MPWHSERLNRLPDVHFPRTSMKRSQAGARAQEAEPGARHRPLSLVPSQRPRRIEQNEAMIEESLMTEGFAAIGLHRPSRPENIGGVLRAADIFGVELVVLGRGTAAGAARTPDRNDASMATGPGGVRRPSARRAARTVRVRRGGAGRRGRTATRARASRACDVHIRSREWLARRDDA